MNCLQTGIKVSTTELLPERKTEIEDIVAKSFSKYKIFLYWSTSLVISKEIIKLDNWVKST